jgi:hypothetical protein
MSFYEIAIGIAVVLVMVAVGGLAARLMMGPEETALLRAARAGAAQRRLVASAAQQERDARAGAAQRRLLAAAAQRDADMALLQAARDAATQRRLVAAAAQQDALRTRSSRRQQPPRIELSNTYWARCLKLQYDDLLAAPLPPRLAALERQLAT